MSARKRFRRFIGVDLGGGRGKNTAVARLELTRTNEGAVRLGVAEAKVRYGQRGTGKENEEPGGDALFRDDVLVEYIERWVDEHTVVAIDAPLTMPPCIRCTLPCPTVERCTVPVVQWMKRWAPRLQSRGRTDPNKPAITPYTQRAAEVLWSAAGVSPRETLGQGTGPLAARAAYLRRTLSPRLRLHENLIEVYPRATLARLVGERQEVRARRGAAERIWDTRKRILAGLGEGIAFDYVWPELVVRNTHVFYAVICAYSAFLWSRHGWKGPHDVAAPEPDDDDDAASKSGSTLRLRQPPLVEAAEDLGDLWIEDGWIWGPPP